MTDSSKPEFTTSEIDAMRYALGDYLAVYINPEIASRTPNDDEKERLVEIAKAYLRAADWDGPLLLKAGEWKREVELS